MVGTNTAHNNGTWTVQVLGGGRKLDEAARSAECCLGEGSHEACLLECSDCELSPCNWSSMLVPRSKASFVACDTDLLSRSEGSTIPPGRSTGIGHPSTTTATAAVTASFSAYGSSSGGGLARSVRQLPSSASTGGASSPIGGADRFVRVGGWTGVSMRRPPPRAPLEEITNNRGAVPLGCSTHRSPRQQHQASAAGKPSSLGISDQKQGSSHGVLRDITNRSNLAAPACGVENQPLKQQQQQQKQQRPQSDSGKVATTAAAALATAAAEAKKSKQRPSRETAAFEAASSVCTRPKRTKQSQVISVGSESGVSSCIESKMPKNRTASLTDANPQLVQEYAADLMRSMLRREHEFMPEASYMQTQPQINAKMRSILNDWLYEVHRKYKLRHETLFLAICILDSYLSKACVSRRRFQLVGVTALLIAAKVEEIEPPQLAELVYVTDNSYSKQDILDMEMAVLGTLGFRVAAPTAAHFLLHLQAASRTPLAATRTERGSTPASGSSPGAHRIEEVAAAAVPPSEREKIRTDLGWYILELSLLDVRIVRHRPSHVAASALLLSGRLVGQRPAWPASVAGLCGLAERDLEACCSELRQMLDAAPRSSLQAIRSRYRHLQSLLPAAGIPQTVATPSAGAEGCEKTRS